MNKFTINFSTGLGKSIDDFINILNSLYYMMYVSNTDVSYIDGKLLLFAEYVQTSYMVELRKDDNHLVLTLTIHGNTVDIIYRFIIIYNEHNNEPNEIVIIKFQVFFMNRDNKIVIDVEDEHYELLINLCKSSIQSINATVNKKALDVLAKGLDMSRMLLSQLGVNYEV